MSRVLALFVLSAAIVTGACGGGDGPDAALDAWVAEVCPAALGVDLALEAVVDAWFYREEAVSHGAPPQPGEREAVEDWAAAYDLYRAALLETQAPDEFAELNAALVAWAEGRAAELEQTNSFRAAFESGSGSRYALGVADLPEETLARLGESVACFADEHGLEQCGTQFAQHYLLVRPS